jgi:hypothetical protein
MLQQPRQQLRCRSPSPASSSGESESGNHAITTSPKRSSSAAFFTYTPSFPCTVCHRLLGTNWQNRARLSDGMLQALMELPGTKGMFDLRDRADALTAWKLALQKGWVITFASTVVEGAKGCGHSWQGQSHTQSGARHGETRVTTYNALMNVCMACSTLPRLDEVSWPQEPFRSKFAVSSTVHGISICGMVPPSTLLQCVDTPGCIWQPGDVSPHPVRSSFYPTSCVCVGVLQDALRNLEMPRFTRRYPAVLNTLIKQMLLLVHVSTQHNE